MDDLTKKNIIVQELATAGLPPNQPTTPPALYNVLDLKSGPMGFDKTVGEQLLKKLQGTGAVLTPSTFADVWIEAERKMLDKINKSQANLDRINARMIVNEQNYNSIANQPQQQQKMLIFRVTESKGFSTGALTNFEFSVGNKSSGIISTEQFQREKFTINIEEMDSTSTVLVNPTPDMQRFEGRVDVPILPFNDRQAHEKEFFIPLMNGGQGLVIIQLEYYQSLRRGYEEAAFDNQENIVSFKDMLESMYSPFPGLGGEKSRLLNTIKAPNDSILGGGSKFSRPFPNEISAVGGPYPQFNSMTQINKSSYYFNATGNQSPSQLMKPELRDNPSYVEPQARGLPQELSAFSVVKDYKQEYHMYVHYLYYVFLFVLLFGLIVCLYRPAFVGLLAAVVYIVWYFVKEETNAQIRYWLYALMLIVAIVLDIFWLIWYTDHLWNTPYIDSDSIWVLRRTAVIMSYFLVVTEAIACFFAVALGANEPLLVRTI